MRAKSEYKKMLEDEVVMRCETVEFNSLGQKSNEVNRWKKEFYKTHKKSDRFEIHTDGNLIMFIWEERLVS